MPVIDTTTSNTSGTSRNYTFGDQYAKGVIPLLYSAAGAGTPGADYMMDRMTPLEYYPDQTYVDQDPYTQAAIQARADRAGAGGLSRGAEGYTSDVLSGKYLNNNPYIDAMYGDAAESMGKQFNRAVLPSLEARFAKSGGMGGSYMGARNAAQEQLAGGLGKMATDIYGQNYARERGAMDRAAALAPTIQQMGYADIDELGRAGQAREEFARTQLQDKMDRFYFQQDEPFSRIARITGGAANLPMAAGTGETKYTQRTVGQAPYHKPESDMPPGWERILLSLI